MKKLLILILFTSITYAQNTTVHFYYGTEKMLGGELMFHIRGTESFHLGGGFSGTLESTRIRPLPNDIKWCSIYATASLGYFKSILVKYKGGLAVYNSKNTINEVNYKPLVGIGAMYSITKDIGIELGYDTFNQGTVGFTILF